MRRQGLLLALLLPAAVPAQAAPNKEPVAAESKAEKQAELSEVRERINAMRRDLAKTEKSRGSAADQLREVELAISDSGRRIRGLANARSAVLAEVSSIERQQKQLSDAAVHQQAQLGALLRQQHRDLATTGGKARDTLQTLLSGRDPNQAARDWHYLKLLSRAQAGLIQNIGAAAAEKRRLADAAREKSAEIAQIEARQKDERAALQRMGKKRRATLERIAGQIRAQRREIGALKRDEQRLGQLIDGLARLASRSERNKAQAEGGLRAPPARRVREIETSGAGGAFAKLRGKLKLPVRGVISGRFGAARPEGGSWKGLFIRAPEGAEVQSVAAGRVAFADWLRGFGNLIIVDHGDGFLSVYGNNQSLLKQAGEEVRAAEVVASAGNSGGNAESGLYFELRHQGQVFDPMKWVNSR